MHSAHLLDSKRLTGLKVIFAISRLSSNMILTPIRRNHTRKVERVVLISSRKVETTKFEIYEQADSAMEAFLSPTPAIAVSLPCATWLLSTDS
jgi:hypothetical protein